MSLGRAARLAWRLGLVSLVVGCLSRPLEQEEQRLGRTPITRRPVPATVAAAPTPPASRASAPT